MKKNKSNYKMSFSNEEILIDYLDNQLAGEELVKAEQLIREDSAAAKEMEHLRFSVGLVREAAVFEQVTAVRAAFSTDAKIISFKKEEGVAVVRSLSKNILRIAAAVILFICGASVYKYAATSPSSVYNENFSSFDLSTSRGNNDDNELEKAYRAKDWMAVEKKFNGQKEKTTKSWFLAGMADMELKNYDKAIVSFNEVITENKNRTDTYYEDEAEYYLALSYLAAHQTGSGVELLKKIRSDKNHLFYKKASAISAIDVRVLELKQ